LGETFVHHSDALRAAGSSAVVRDFDLASESDLAPDKSIKIVAGADG